MKGETFKPWAMFSAEPPSVDSIAACAEPPAILLKLEDVRNEA